jgi:ABC-type glycerol-3-phosphate transport system substrate-binding protein
MGGVLLAGVRRRHPIFHLFCLLALGLVAIAGMTACGGGGGSGSSGKGSQTSTVTITASSGTISHTATYSLATTD